MTELDPSSTAPSPQVPSSEIKISGGEPLKASLPPLQAQVQPSEISSQPLSASPPDAGPLSCNVSSEDVYRLLDGYFEGLEAGRQQNLYGHVENCDCCTDVVQFQLGLRSVIGSVCREDMPEDVRQRLLDSLNSWIR